MIPKTKTERQNAYRNFVIKESVMTLFLQPWWLDMTCNKNWDVSLIYRNDELYDAIPYNITKRIIFRLLRPPLITPYLANVRYKNDGDFLKAIKTLPQCDETFIFRPSLYKEYENSKLADTKHYYRTTYFVDLHKSWEDIDKNIPKKRHAKIRKARQQVTVHINEWDSQLFQKWQSAAFNDKNILYPYHKNYIQELIETAWSHNALITLCAKYGDLPIAYVALFYDHETMYYLLGAKDHNYNTANAMSLLIYESIRMAHKMNLRIFDFEGSSDEGIAHFFSKFSSTRSCYEVFHKNNSFLWKLKKKFFS